MGSGGSFAPLQRRFDHIVRAGIFAVVHHAHAVHILLERTRNQLDPHLMRRAPLHISILAMTKPSDARKRRRNFFVTTSFQNGSSD